MATIDVIFWTDEQGRKRVMYGKANHLSPYNVSYGIKDPNKNSVRDNLNHRGDNLSTERRKLHNQIIQEVFEGHEPYKEGEPKYALYTGGAPASGKGTFTHDVEKYYSNKDNPVILDADALKERLLFADTGKKRLDDATSQYYHSESVILQKRLYEIAIQNDYPVLLDGTSTAYPQFFAKLQQAKNNGYRTRMCFMMADANSLLNGSLDRYRKEGRIVPLNRILQVASDSQTVLPKMFNDIDDITVYYRSGSRVTPVAKGGNGKQHIADNQIWRNVMSSNAYNLDSGAINMYYSKVNAIKNGH